MLQYKYIGNQLLNATFQFFCVKELFFYSLPLVPLVFLSFANDKAIIYLLRDFISLTALADYSFSTKLVALLSLVFFALRMALEPKVNHFVSFPHQDNFDQFKKYINIYIVLSFALFFVFFILAPYFQLYFFPDFTHSVDWSFILSISLILLNLSTYVTPGFSIKKRMDIKLLIIIPQVIFNFVGFYLILESGHGVTFALKYLVFINYIFLSIQHYFSNKLYKVSNEYLKLTALFSLVFVV